MNHLASRQFSWNVKSYFLLKVIKVIRMLSALILLSALTVNQVHLLIIRDFVQVLKMPKAIAFDTILMLSMLGKNFSRWGFEICFLVLFFSPKIGIDFSFKFSICLEYQSQFSGKNKENVMSVGWAPDSLDSLDTDQLLHCWVDISADDSMKHFFLFLAENRIWCFMQIVSDNLYEMSSCFLGKKNKKNNYFVVFCWVCTEGGTGWGVRIFTVTLVKSFFYYRPCCNNITSWIF